MDGLFAASDAMKRIIRLKSRCGEGYMLLLVLFIPFALIVLSLAIDGLGMATTYARAVGLAKVAAQAGAGTVAFDGTRVMLRGDACAVALRSIGDNSGTLNLVQTHCTQTNNRVLVQVRLRPLRMFGGSFALPIDHVDATAYAEPQFGINERE